MKGNKILNEDFMRTKNLFGKQMLFLFTFPFIRFDKEDEKIQQFEFTSESLNPIVWKGNIVDPICNGGIGINFEIKQRGKVHM